MHTLCDPLSQALVRRKLQRKKGKKKEMTHAHTHACTHTHATERRNCLRKNQRHSHARNTHTRAHARTNPSSPDSQIIACGRMCEKQSVWSGRSSETQQTTLQRLATRDIGRKKKRRKRRKRETTARRLLVGTSSPVPVRCRTSFGPQPDRLSPQSQSFSRSYGSGLPTSLTYIVLSTRGCSPWRPAADMGTVRCGNHYSLPRIFKGRRERSGHRKSRGALQEQHPSLRASRFQGVRPLQRKENSSRGPRRHSPSSLRVTALDLPPPDERGEKIDLRIRVREY